MKYMFEGGKNLKLAYAYLKQSSRKSTWISVINFGYKSYSFHDAYKSPDFDSVRIKGIEMTSCQLKRNIKIVQNVGEKKTVTTVTFGERDEGKIILRYFTKK